MPEVNCDGPAGWAGAGGRFRRGTGCEACVGTGYRGRLGIFELLEYSDALKQTVLRHHNYQTLKEEAERSGMRNLREDALIKWLKGTTTLDEVIRVT